MQKSHNSTQQRLFIISVIWQIMNVWKDTGCMEVKEYDVLQMDDGIECKENALV